MTVQMCVGWYIISRTYTPRRNHFFCSFSVVHVTFLAREENCTPQEIDKNEISFDQDNGVCRRSNRRQ